MNNFYSVPVSKKFYPLLVVALVVFFILRFSPVLLELFLKFKPGSLPPTGIFTSPTVLGVMILVFLGSAWAIHRNFHILKAFIESNPKRFLTIALVGMICVLAIGKLSFAVYTDEKRDIFVSNLMTRAGVQTYSQLNIEKSTPMSSEEKSYLDWARSLHPIGHYLPALLVHKKEGTIFWRYFYGFFPLLLVVVLIWRWKPLDKEQIWFIALVGIIMLSSAYFRNYVLIRVSNELIPAMGMTCFFLLLWRASTGRQISWPVEIVLLALPVFISVSAKYSATVTWGAAVLALTVVWLAKRDWPSAKTLLLCAGSGLLGVGLHVYLWVNTDMLAGHRDNYGVKILKTLGIAPPQWMHVSGMGLEGSTSSMQFLLLGSPVWFGPFIFVGILLGSWLFFEKALWRDPLWLFLIVFLATNLAGVLAVNPRAAYLSPAGLPIAVFCALAYKKALSAQHCRELVFLAYAFVVINVLIISISSVKW
jgi:hypothetical protein